MSSGLIGHSTLAPDEQSRHRVVPHHDPSARRPRPRAHQIGLLVVDRKGHADIGEQADAADEVERQQPAQDRNTPSAAGRDRLKKLFRMKLEVMAIKAPAACTLPQTAPRNSFISFQRDVERAKMHKESVCRRHMAQHEDRNRHATPRRWSVLPHHSPRKSSATMESSLLSPCMPRAEGEGNLNRAQLAWPLATMS